MGKLDEAALDRFFAALDHLNETALMVMTAAFHAIPQTEHEAAWAEVRRATEKDGLGKEVQALRDQAMGWSYQGSNVPAMPYSMRSEVEWVTLRRNAAAAVVDAALAVALGERLDEGTRGILLGPWLSAAGQPG